MTLDEARQILPEAEYRPPAQRGDFDALAEGAVVGLVDGRFEQARSLSQREVNNAVVRGISILGSSSMGALRAAEVRGVQGVGRIYEMYRDGIIDRDDEVALVYDEERLHAYTVPLVNVRYAVQRLVNAATIEGKVGERIVKAAERMHYTERSYKEILRAARLLEQKDAQQLLEFLSLYDLKKEDAQSLLEQMPRFFAERRGRRAPSGAQKPVYLPGEVEDHFSAVRVAGELSPDSPVLIWEFGDLVNFDGLLTFLKMTGQFEHHALRAAARFWSAGNKLEVELPPELQPAEEDILADVHHTWGWQSAEEFKVSLRDLGVGFRELRAHAREEVAARCAIISLALQNDPGFKKAMRAELLLDDLSLKRAALRCGSLAYFAKCSRAKKTALTKADRRAASSVLLHVNRQMRDGSLIESLTRQGVSRAQFDAFVDELAHARREAADIARALWGPRAAANVPVRLPAQLKTTLGLTRSLKAKGSQRFCMPMARAAKHARKLAKAMGVTRIGMIGELTNLGVQISQAYRPHNTWSSTSGSGKGFTRAGALVGAVMEEVEKYAQDNFTCETVVGSYVKMKGRVPTLDPSTLDLPYDSVYHPELEIAWTSALDLLTGQQIYVPAAVLDRNRLKNDIYYCRRRGGKMLGTNGLASGFTAAEALLHATCEFIERHAERIADLVLDNPGQLGGCPDFSFIDLATLPKSPARLAHLFKRGGYQTKILDITCAVKVPTFRVAVYSADGVSFGHATHPNSGVAIEMALFEAAQGVAVQSAGAREDMTIKARSLGRHERSRRTDVRSGSFWYGDWIATQSLQQLPQFVSNSVLLELEWVLGALAAAGVEHVLTQRLALPNDLRPAHVFRVIIPGLETNNPFYIGSRGRAHGLRYLLDPARFAPIL